MTKISFYNQGCRLNQSETATLEQTFLSGGHAVVPLTDAPDVVVVNTCTVTENGDVDTRRLVSKIVRDNPDCKIALIGCQAQILKDQLLKLPNVQWVIGNAQKMNLMDLMATPVETPQVIVPKMTRETFTIDTPAVDTRHTRANIKVQDGCDFYCAFCVIPFARGPARSRDYDDTIRETVALVGAGHQELVVTGINVGTYNDGTHTFLDLLNGMMKVPGLNRLRISSIEPTTVDDAVIQLMAADNALCRYLHLPIQSGTDEILERMSRKYTVTEFTNFVNRVTEVVPGLGLGTDVIVGFPGETSELFDQTAGLLESLPFTYFHVFSYSERMYARSQKQPDKVSGAEIQRRSKILRDLSDRKKRFYMTQQIGTTQSVLFEAKKRGQWVGLTETYIRVAVTSDRDLTNTVCPVLLTDVEHDKMTGSLVNL
ncbi:tRNA (N(6)-L-threonylcarbamoyladenosine(37)-C(2))-methylthiotransferase MtaB [bacterium]|nr:tRNA (N(6)-L-threonylcarbamoyladenosine(37)-C(2))-methylthiotransferase MtaB [bacterium]